jgi:tetratricopeptide (TPR) repeat protein
LNSGDKTESGDRKQGRPLVPPSASVTRRGGSSEDRALEALDEYTGSTGAQAVETGEKRERGAQGEIAGSSLQQEWELEEDGVDEAPYGDDVLARLERMEKRLDAFESTAYSFLLYAKQLTDRTASFFEDVFGLGQEDIAQIHDRLGVNHNNKGDYPRAIEAFRKLAELKRTSASCYKLGVAYDNNGDLQEAIESFRTAISLDETNLKAYYRLADVYGKSQNFGEAVRCLTKASEIVPDSPETHFRLGTVHSARGSHDQAITAFNRVLSLSPSFAGIYQSLGLAYEQKGEHNKAIEFFKKSI